MMHDIEKGPESGRQIQSSPDTPHENLAYIRQTMDAARQFTAVPGQGLVAMGVLGLAAAFATNLLLPAKWDGSPSHDWLAIWLMALTVATVVGALSMYAKASRTGQSLRTELFRKIVWGMTPALALGGVLTVAIILQTADWRLLAPVWLGSYGIAVVAGGQYSVLPVRMMGLGFLVLAGIAALAAPGFETLLLAIGFGVVHVGFGAYIAWRYDG